MAYDPCCTKRLEGDEIIKRLAEYLQVSPTYLAAVLYKITKQVEENL